MKTRLTVLSLIVLIGFSLTGCGGGATSSPAPNAAPSVSVSTSPANAKVISGAVQQYTAIVGNTPDKAVTWSTTAGSISASGLFTAPNVSIATSAVVTATSHADTRKSGSADLSVNPAISGLTVSPTSLSFTAESGTSNPASANVAITNTGSGALNFTGVSDQPWLLLSAASGTAPSALQLTAAMNGLNAGTYTGHVTVTGGAISKLVTVILTVTSPLSHMVSLSWQASSNSDIVSYSMYRSTISGNSYGLLASAIGKPAYVDQTVQSGNRYFYVVTAVDGQGRESAYSSQTALTIP